MGRLMTSDPYIKVYDKIVPPSYCNQLITLFRSNPLVHSGVAQGEGVPQGHKICDELHIREVYRDEKRADVLNQWKRVDEQLFGFVNPLLIAYIDEFKVLQGQPIRDEGFRFKRYPKGEGTFGMHVDMTPETPTRVMAVIVYLNDVTEGGETEFPWQGMKVSPRVGRVCIAPTFWTYPHQSCIPISEDKFIVNNFAMF
jgi:hypothetical protein